MPIDCQVFINHSDDFGGVVGSKRGIRRAERAQQAPGNSEPRLLNQLGDVEQICIGLHGFGFDAGQKLPADEIVLG